MDCSLVDDGAMMIVSDDLNGLLNRSPGKYRGDDLDPDIPRVVALLEQGIGEGAEAMPAIKAGVALDVASLAVLLDVVRSAFESGRGVFKAGKVGLYIGGYTISDEVLKALALELARLIDDVEEAVRVRLSDGVVDVLVRDVLAAHSPDSLRSMPCSFYMESIEEYRELGKTGRIKYSL